MSYSSANHALSKSDCYTVAGLVGSIRGRQDPNSQAAAPAPSGQEAAPNPGYQAAAPRGFRANSEAIF